MKYLAVEILEEIFKSLHQKDKVECMLVCHAWKHAIKNTILFNTICLHNRKQLDKLVDNIRLEPQNGNRVVRLVVEAMDLRKSDITLLPSLFPHIREINLHQNFYFENSQSKASPSFQPWKKSIRIITDIYGNFPTYQILRGGLCPRLVEIQINGRHRDSSAQLIDLLGNAPNLKVLKLSNYTFSLTGLEMLHHNVPLLESLSLVASNINALVLPKYLKPARHMEKLNLRGVSTVTTENFINLENYLTNKYPHIDHLVFNFVINHEHNLEACMNRGFELQIQQIGSNLTSLEFLNDDNSIGFFFPILDRHGCKIKKVAINRKLQDSEFQQITQSNQAQYIQALSYHPESCLPIIHHFHKLAALTQLELSFDASSATVDMSNLMNVIGDHLEILELCSAEISLDMAFIPLCPKLKKLTLQHDRLPPGFDSFISQACPNLRNFVLNMCAWESPRFCMEGISLSYLEIRMQLPIENNHILMMTTGNKRWYTSNKMSAINRYPITDPFIFPAVKSLPFEKYSGIPYKTFLCKSVYDFLLVNVL